MAAPASITRHWWLKRLTAWGLVVLLAWSAGHAALWWSGSSRLEAHVDRWRADGGPLPEQIVLTPPKPKNPENAATWIIRAYEMLPPLTRAQSVYWNNAEIALPLKGAQLETMRSIAQQDEPAFAAFRRAYEHPKLDWGTPAVRIETMLPRLSSYRNLATHLQCAGLVHHQDAELSEALQCAEDLVFLTEAMVGDGPSVVTSLVTTGVHGVGTSLLQDIVARPLGDLTPEQEREQWRAAAPQVRELIGRLLNSSVDDRLVHLAVRGERTSIYAVQDLPVAWRLSENNPFTRPFLLHQIDRELKQYEQVAQQALTARTWSDIAPASTWRSTAAPQSGAEMMASSIEDIFDPGWGRVMLAFWRVRTERRATAVLLAIELYQADHEGQAPPTLAALVPEYLPAVPTDPFAADEGGLCYLASGRTPIVYSAGKDGIDDGGDWRRVGGEVTAGDAWSMRDVPFLLHQPPDPAVTLAQWLGVEEEPATLPASTAPASE